MIIIDYLNAFSKTLFWYVVVLDLIIVVYNLVLHLVFLIMARQWIVDMACYSHI